MSGKLLYEGETYKIIGAAMEVHKELGCGFLEAVYQEALEIEFNEQFIPNQRETLITIRYKGFPLQKFYKADFICFKKIIVEIKAVQKLTNIDEAQLFNYLKATGYKVGLLFNFGEETLRYRRLIY